jgi:hypothetical protein
MAENDRIKIAGYARRIFFNDNIEYRNFSPDLVGLQLTSEGGTTLFTNGNFSIDVNLDPKPDVVFKQGTKSKLFCLDDIVTNPTEQSIQKNIKTNLNLDLTNPLTYIWYGSSKELIRSSLIQSQENFPAAIYVDDKVGSVTGNNITNYVYNISTDESTFTVNSRFFVNPYNIKYTLDSQYIPIEDTSNKLRNFTVNYSSYVIEHNGISKPIIGITPTTQSTNSDLEIVVRGNPFPELTGIYIPTLSFLFTNVDASIPYFIKPNETEIEGFFTSLNDFQKNILSRETNPPYNSIIISTEVTDDGLILTTKETLEFPILEDGYNLNFFDSFYLTYLSKLIDIGEDLDESRTDIIIRKYTTEAISSFDTLPSAGDDDLTINGEKATKLLRIYGVEFDHVKKYINGIKFAHIVTYDKKNNIPDTLVKDLSHMLGLDPITFVTSTDFNKLLLPSNGAGEFSGTSVNYTQDQIDIELYRRLILNVAWLWKSKGTRKSIEFLFRFIGAPEALVNFNEYIVMVDKPLDMDKIKELLYIYTGDVSEVDLQNIPYDSNGYPLPPINGQLVIHDFIDPETGEIVENEYTDMYFQKGGGWYRNTYGGEGLTVLRGNNPHVGPYDGGNEYLQYFSRCYIPNFNSEPAVEISVNTLKQNYFINYNYGLFNGIPTGTTEFFTTQLTYNPITNGYQPIDKCVDINYSIIETPLQNDGKTTFQQTFEVAEQEYESFQAQIQQNSYLAYSPEWQTIQNNYELAQSNCLSEVSTEACGTNDTLQICVDELVPDVLPFNCGSLSAVTDCSPFLYYVDPTNGQKVSFDEFSECCLSYGNDYKYVNYINAAGRKSEYCAASAPCVDSVNGVLENGIVAFNVVGNNPPPDVYEVLDYSSNSLICVQFIGDATILADQMSQEALFDGYPLTPQGYIDAYTDLAPPGTNFLTTDSQYYWLEVACTPTTIISSPECCAWHGFDYQVVANSSPQGTFYGTVSPGDNYIVCITNTNLVSSELITSSPQLSIPQINLSANTTYNEFSNPVGDVNGFYTTDVNRDCLNEALIITGTIPLNSSNFYPIPNSVFSSQTLNTLSNWEVNTIDQYGRVSFSPIDLSYNFLLDWNSMDELGILYQQLAEYYGYQFGQFTFNCDNVLIPYYGSGSYSTINSVTEAAVDPSRIGCDDINNVSVVFGSENWQGFKLPEIVDCSCTVDFSFDYMLKYDVENLMECIQKDPCYPTIFNEASLNNIDCRNFIVFTDNEEDPNNQSSLINNFNGNSTPAEEYVIWQNNNCIIEPPSDCCTSVGGNVVLVNEWAATNETWVNYVNETYESVKDSLPISLKHPLPSDLTAFITEYSDIVNNLNVIIDGCDYSLTIPTDDCNIDYSEYIQTTNVCSLDVPLECGLWTKTLTDYRNLIDAVNNTITQFTGYCGEVIVNSPVTINRQIPDTSDGIVKAVQNKNKLKTEKNSELKTLSVERGKLDIKIADINGIIDGKRSDNLVITQATTTIQTELDCGVYEDKIKEINNFNYKSFCTSTTKTNEYDNCVTTQTLINEEQKLLYTELLKNCTLNNSLQTQLTKAKFDNNSGLIGELQKQIFVTETKIDTLTKSGSKFIESDPSQQTSKLQVNNKIETIKRTSELLNTTVESITNSDGDLTLTTSQKIELNILSVKNESQINSLLLEKSEIESLKSDNISKTNGVNNNINGNNLSGTLFSWGVGLIGAGLFLKGILDPETTTGMITAAVAISTNKLDQQTFCDNLKPFTSSVTGEILDSNYNSIPEQCCTSSVVGQPVTYGNQFVKAGCFPLCDLGLLVSAPNGEILDGNNNSIPEECCTSTVIGYPVTYGGQFGKGCFQNSFTNCSFTANTTNIWDFDSIYYEVTINGLPLSEECCDSSITPWPVYWALSPNPFSSGYRCLKGFAPGDCPLPEDVQVVDGFLMNYSVPLSEECCSDKYDYSPVVTGSIYPVYDRNGGEYLGCAETQPVPYDPCCDITIIEGLVNTLEELESKVTMIEEYTQNCYGEWLNTLNQNYQNFLIFEQQNYLKYLDDLKLNFKLFVNNTNVNTNTNIDTDLTYLPYTQSINPIWEWDPTQQYSGVILDGSEINIATVEDAIYDTLSTQNINFSPDMFEPNWSTLNFTIPECVCDDLRRLYPDKEFFFSIELENYECSLCLLVDNISVNVTDCKTQRLLSLNDCLTPQLSCVIDNKKSWVYTDKGVVTETIYPNGECNPISSSNYNVTKLTTPEERLWLNLEYRYTNYEVNHSDLIVNVKNASFSIDPAKSIECDVYDFWKNIDCDNCPTSCTTGETITFSGQVYTSTTLGDYTLDVSASTSGISFSCDTYTSILTDQVLELKNDYYSLTADYNESLDANYYDLLNKGGSLSKFYIQKNNCGSDTIVINNNNNIDNLFGLITEDSDGTLSFYESYIYSGSTPYVGGTLTEVISGITAQTFNQTTGITLDCCTSLNELINDKGTLGLGIGKNYVWDTTTSSCNWKEIDSCKGDCEYSGTKKVISREDCLSGITTGITVDVCVNPLDYLDFTPSQITTKENFDSMVLSNLIDVKSRQTISDYPTLRLFYQLYLTANNCGEELSGKLTYNNLFEFMDKIGDYWLDLLEQVVPATTIWEGCDNSGKIFRNTIFDQNKFNYKKYNLNFVCGCSGCCPVSGRTDYSIGSQDVYAVLEVIPIYPTNDEIIQTKNDILTIKVDISNIQKLITNLTTQLCALNLQDSDTTNVLNVQAFPVLNNQINNLNQTLVTQQTTLSDLLIQLEQQQTEYLSQQSNYYSKFMSCTGLTESLITAQNNLTNFIPGTTNYERQRNFIANIRSKLNKCIKRSSMLLTNEDSVAFITQIYDTNEYEGNITIMGDEDWEEGGPFYNTELIHNC